MIIDAHAHAYDNLSGYGARGEIRPIGKGRGIWATGEVEQFFPEAYGDLGFTAEMLIKLMAENGVDHAVLLQGGNYGFHNDYAAEAARKYPDKFTAVGTLDPYGKNALKILDRFLRDYGFKALKFEISQSWGLTGYHPGLRMNDAYFAPILERANERKMTVTIDMGPLSNTSFDIGQLVDIKNRYPDITFVMTHCFFAGNDGKNPYRLETMRELAADNFVFDISNLPVFVYPEAFPFPSQQEFLRQARNAVGAERMIWGTDLPSTFLKYTYREMIDFVTQGNIFTDDELELVMGKNAKRVYHIDTI